MSLTFTYVVNDNSQRKNDGTSDDCDYGDDDLNEDDLDSLEPSVASFDICFFCPDVECPLGKLPVHDHFCSTCNMRHDQCNSEQLEATYTIKAMYT